MDTHGSVFCRWDVSIFIAVLLCSFTFPHSSAINTLNHTYGSCLLLLWSLLEFAILSLADSGLGAPIDPSTDLLATIMKLNLICSVIRLFHGRQPLLRIMIRVGCRYHACGALLGRVPIRCGLWSVRWRSRVVRLCHRPLPRRLVLRPLIVNVYARHLVLPLLAAIMDGQEGQV